MSELQISLLAIGIVVVVAVYGYSAWQQREYRRRFGAAFKQRHGDALYQPSAVDLLEGMAENAGDGALPGKSARVNAMDEVCTTLDAATDYIATLSAAGPMNAAVLAPLWQSRFDFGKSVNVCGRVADGQWEKVIAESHLSYNSFRLALQLVDRNGAVTEARLGTFREMVRSIADQAGADASLPEVADAAQRAQQLDAFCAEVDQMIGLNILPSGDRLLSAAEIARVAGQHGLTLQADGAFHLLDERGHTLFSLANFDNDPFQHHTLNQMQAVGLSLQLDVPRVERPAQRFDEMALLAREIGMGLRAAVVDDYRVALSEAAIAMIRAQVSAIEEKMVSRQLIPGSTQARRLFS